MERVPKIFGNFRILQPSMPGEGGTANPVKFGSIRSGMVWQNRRRRNRAGQRAGLSVQLIDDKLLHVDASQCRIAEDA
jgi:hypothetical protein